MVITLITRAIETGSEIKSRNIASHESRDTAMYQVLYHPRERNLFQVIDPINS